MTENLIVLASLIPTAWFLDRYGKAEIRPVRIAQASAPVVLRSMVYAALILGGYLLVATLDAVS